MSMLTEFHRTTLRRIFTDAQVDTSLVLYRYDENAGTHVALAAQTVQVRYNRQRQANGGGSAGIELTLTDLTFYREAPFDVRVGDAFSIDSHKGGTIRRVGTDPVLGVIVADADLDVGAS